MQNRSDIQPEGADTPLADVDPEMSRFKRYRSWITFAIVICLLVVVTVINRQRTLSPEEKLAAMDAERAIPDEDNAALVYAKLLSNFVTINTLSDLAKTPNPPIGWDEITQDLGLYQDSNQEMELRGRRWRHRPFSNADYPELAERIKELSNRIGILEEAGNLSQCRFLLSLPTDRENTWQNTLYESISRHKDLLETAAYLDLGEKRPLKAFNKTQTMIRISDHIYQHPTEDFINSGFVTEYSALRILNTMLITENDIFLDVNELRESCNPLVDQWKSIEQQLNQVMPIIYEQITETPSLIDRWEGLVRYGNWKTALLGTKSLQYTPVSHLKLSYQSLLSIRRQHRILIELRNLKNQTGQWPTRLEQIDTALPSQITEDIKTKSPFSYFLAKNLFVLFNLQASPQEPDEHEILVYHNQTLTTTQSNLLHRQIQFYIDLLSEKGGKSYYHQKCIRMLLPHSLPLLLANLKSIDTDIKLGILEILERLADEDRSPKERYTSFLPELVQGYQTEQNVDVKKAYIVSLAQFRNVSAEQHKLVVQTLEGIANRPTEQKYLRIEAFRALVHVSKLFEMEFYDFSAAEIWRMQQGLYGGMLRYQPDNDPEQKAKLDEWIAQVDFDPNTIELIGDAIANETLWYNNPRGY